MHHLVQKSAHTQHFLAVNCKYSLCFWIVQIVNDGLHPTVSQSDCRGRNTQGLRSVGTLVGVLASSSREKTPGRRISSSKTTSAETDGFYIRNNRFERTKDCGIRLFNAWYSRWTMENNVWKIPRHWLLRYHARPTDGLEHKYPDYLDRTHNDDEAEIQSQTVEEPLRLRGNRRGLSVFQERFCK